MTSTMNQPYATGLTRSNIERALAKSGRQTDAIRASDQAMLEDFYSLGRLATVTLIDLTQISASDRILDAGTGIGGTARLIAAKRGARITAVDLTAEYWEVAKWLNDAVGLGDMIEVRAADVTELPFWAASQSHLVTPERLAELLLEASFAIAHWSDLTERAENAMREIFAGELPPLGLHVFVPDFQAKAANPVRNLAEDRARLIQAVLTVAAPLASEQPPNAQPAPPEPPPPSFEWTRAKSDTQAIATATSGSV